MKITRCTRTDGFNVDATIQGFHSVQQCSVVLNEVSFLV